MASCAGTLRRRETKRAAGGGRWLALAVWAALVGRCGAQEAAPAAQTDDAPAAVAETPADAEASAGQVDLGPVVCLTTEWYPVSNEREMEAENRLVREIVRQGVLMAAREELGLVTRDETVGEPFPKGWRPPSDGAAKDKDKSEADDTATGAAPMEPLSAPLLVDTTKKTWEVAVVGVGRSAENPL